MKKRRPMRRMRGGMRKMRLRMGGMMRRMKSRRRLSAMRQARAERDLNYARVYYPKRNKRRKIVNTTGMFLKIGIAAVAVWFLFFKDKKQSV